MAEYGKKKQIPVGIDDFERLVEGNYYFADKSLLIKELLDSGAVVTLIPRPRRFGKTLNLSMLRYFFEKSEGSRGHLFKGLKLEQYPDCMKHQGQYPVIWLTFKDVKTDEWEVCYEKTCKVIGSEFKRHFDVISRSLSELEVQHVQKIIAGTASRALYENALLDLSLYLERTYKTRVMIFIDEYDAPIHAGYLKGYYNEVVSFMRGFMGAGLKGNSALNFSVLTGILRVAKESIFSGMNNLEVCSLVRKNYDDKFGFLEDEVAAMLSYFGLENQQDEVRAWYNGYQSGSFKVYNPWSIINLVKNGGELQAYWVNTSDNALIKDLLRKSSIRMKEELEIIIKGGKVTKPLQENIVMPDLDANDEVVWIFLLFCGYLTFENYRLEGRTRMAELSVPNEEVMQVYETSFKNWFESSVNRGEFQRMLENLVAGQPESFKKNFERFSLTTLSYFDIQGDQPELFYHALVLGMLASLSNSYDVRSNRESGYGRYDVVFIPKDHSKPGIVLEFKAVDLDKKETLEIAAKKALKQIEDNKYETELRALGLKKILKLGIAFLGKESLVLIG
ncbi:TPA: AAA family ATPase [Candidatus Dependentiae bacterium]|nr:MAG: hypothetical protein UW09_C0001G0078 [candidate division TM6 bacterium GW2011_GWF2_43_87]HBL98557.1 AAA family ATPase [Candidatus Dependentiae bacterium]